jgi:uncharacterized protein
LPKATRFINLYAGLLKRKTLQCRIFFFSLSEIHAAPRVYNAMKLHSTPTQHYQTVTAYDDAGVEINAVRFSHSLIVLPETAPANWAVTSFDSLTPDHFAQIDALTPDVVILGTGARQRFIHPRLVAALTTRRIGVECMDNQAACRTYNILMAEGRKVALALIFDHP